MLYRAVATLIEKVEAFEERVESLESKLDDSSEEVGRLRRRLGRLNDFIDDEIVEKKMRDLERSFGKRRRGFD